MALAPEAHAVEMQRLAPANPWRIDSSPAVALAIIIGTRNGLTRLGPRSTRDAIWSSSVVMPADACPGQDGDAGRIDSAVPSPDPPARALLRRRRWRAG